MVRAPSGELAFAKADAAEVGGGLKRLLGCYPAGKPADPQVYVAAVTAVLARYPNEIVQQVTDPVGGLPSRCKFLPTIAELTEALNSAMAPSWAEYNTAKREAIQTQERLRIAAIRTPENDAKVKAKIVELSNKLKTAPEAVREVQKKSWEQQAERNRRVFAEVAAKKTQGSST